MGSSQLCLLSKSRLRDESFHNDGFTLKTRDTSLADKVAFLAQGLKDLADLKFPKTEADPLAVLHNHLLLHVESLQSLRIDMARTDEHAHHNLRMMQANMFDLEAKLRSTEEERKKVAQELKHTENERLKANERVRGVDEKLKKALEQGELDRKQVAQERSRAQQLQKRVEELQKNTGRCTHHEEVKAKKAKDTAPDVAGLQRGLEKVKGQLKKKQDEFQAQAQTLQQTTAKVKNLEQKATDDQKKIQHLQEQIQFLTSQMEEERVEMRSAQLKLDIERQRGNESLAAGKEKYWVMEARASAEIARLNWLLDQEEESVARLMLQMSEEGARQRQLLELEQDRSDKLVDTINKLEERQNTYDPLGDADIADRIRIRNLVDQAQERLATKAGLAPSGPGELLSLTWRVALGPNVDDSSRVRKAKELLADKDLDEHDRAFLADDQAFRHACQHYSRFRKPGNDLHQLMPRDGYMTSVQRHLRFNPAEDRGDALVAMVDYIFSPLS